MSLALMELEPVCAQDAADAQGHRVERTAFYFQSQGHSLFAWLHRPADVAASHGVLICPPIGHERVHSHRALRYLADQLAAQGFAALRFDYHGTGDSDGSDHEAHRLSTWQVNVRDAAAWLRDQGDCNHVSLIGLRMGATLAALHADQQHVENLVLWEPIVKGRRYVRELTALSMTASQQTEKSSLIEAMGFSFTHETLQALAKVDLLAAKPRFRAALIVHSARGSGDPALCDSLASLGRQVQQVSLPGYEEMMAEPQLSEVPDAAVASILKWFASRRDDDAGGGAMVHKPVLTSMQTQGPERVRESLHQLSAEPSLFGILTEPLEGRPDLPWMVILNGGAAYHIGPGRLHVRLARHLAKLGYPCLRVDISGLGDSPADDVSHENDAYAATAFRDVALTCDYLKRLQPGRLIVLMGLCSGAYAAFQSAVQLPHPEVIEGIMLNPLTFFWREGMSLTTSPTQRLQTWHYYRGIIFDSDNWRQLFSSESESGLAGAVQRFFQRMFPRTKKTASPQVNRDTGSDYGHPETENLSADLARVAGSARKLSMFVSEGDPGRFLLMHQAKRKATQLIRKGVLKCFTIKEADHTFSTEASRQTLTKALTDYLASRFGPSQ